MEDLVLVKKNENRDHLDGTRTGRPQIETFVLRRYAIHGIVAIPVGLTQPGDKADFYLSKSGFAVEVGPHCSRTISGKAKTRTVAIPPATRKALAHVEQGSYNLIAEARPNGVWYFPFSQFAK